MAVSYTNSRAARRQVLFFLFLKRIAVIHGDHIDNSARCLMFVRLESADGYQPTIFCVC